MRQRLQPRKRGFGQFGDFHLDLLARADHGFQLGIRAGRQGAPVIHDHDACADLLHFLHVMAGVHHGGAGAVHLLDAFEDGVPALGVHGHGGLVEEHEFGLVRNAADDVEAAQKATGQFARAELHVVFQPHERHGFVHQFAPPQAVAHVQRAEIVDVLAHRQFFEHRHVLWHHADAALEVVTGRLHGLAEQPDGPFVVGEQLQDAVDGRRFARTVWS